MTVENRIEELKTLQKKIDETITLDHHMYEYIIKVLKRFGGNRSHSAQALNIQVRTLRYRIVQAEMHGYDVPPPAKRGRKKNESS